MTIIIDFRETQLIDILKKEISIETKHLDIGDIQLFKDDKCKLIIERKSINDLASSIQDGRYREQSHRLTKSSLHNHRIFYIIEGNINTWKSKYGKITNSAIYSAIFSLNFFHGFSIFNTNSVDQTATLINHWYNKLIKDTKLPFYECSSISNDYCESIKISKKSFTKTNCDKIMLMQIPGISSTIAECLLKKHTTLFKLLNTIKNNPLYLDSIKYTTKTGKHRKLSKTIISNINNLIQ